PEAGLGADRADLGGGGDGRGDGDGGQVRQLLEVAGAVDGGGQRRAERARRHDEGARLGLQLRLDGGGLRAADLEWLGGAAFEDAARLAAGGVGRGDEVERAGGVVVAGGRLRVDGGRDPGRGEGAGRVAELDLRAAVPLRLPEEPGTVLLPEREGLVEV